MKAKNYRFVVFRELSFPKNFSLLEFFLELIREEFKNSLLFVRLVHFKE